MRTPDYVLSDDVTIGYGQDAVKLLAGTFVRPIEDCYFPKHIKDTRSCKDEFQVGCYTPKGIFFIPRDRIRRA